MKHYSTFTISLLLTFLLLSNTHSFAQTRLFYLSKQDNVSSDTISVNLYTNNFIHIEDFQFSVDWDTTVLTYISNSIPVNAVGLNSGDMNASRNGVGIGWFDKTLLGVTVPDSTILLTVKFVFKNGVL